METNFKLKYNFWAINFLIFVIFFTIGIENTIAQDDNSNISDLEIVNIYFPDTVTIGETVTLRVYLRNEGIGVFTTDLSIYYNIEDINFQPNSSEFDESERLQNIVLLPGEGVFINKDIEISASKFSSNTTSVIIIWPEIASLREANSTINYSFVETYVVNYNSEDTATGTVDQKSNTNPPNKNSANYLQNSKKGLYNLSINSLSQNFIFSKSNNHITINSTLRAVELIGASVFSIDGKVLHTINTNSSFPINIASYSQPVIIKLNIRNQKQPNNIFTFTKIL